MEEFDRMMGFPLERLGDLNIKPKPEVGVDENGDIYTKEK